MIIIDRESRDRESSFLKWNMIVIDSVKGEPVRYRAGSFCIQEG